jgi:hypothetical protein
MRDEQMNSQRMKKWINIYLLGGEELYDLCQWVNEKHQEAPGEGPMGRQRLTSSQTGWDRYVICICERRLVSPKLG